MAQLDTEKNRIGGKRVATSLSKKDNPASIPYTLTVRNYALNEGTLDTALIATGYTQPKLNVMNLNDKLFALRVELATSPLTI